MGPEGPYQVPQTHGPHWGTEVPQWGPGVWALGDEVLKKLKQFADIVYGFLLQKYLKSDNFHTIHLLILDQSVSRWWLSDVLLGV